MGMKRKINSIQTRILFSFFVLVALTIYLYTIFSIHYTRHNLVENARKNREELVKQVNYNIENYIDYMENISQVLMGDMDIEQYLFADNGEEEQVKAQLQEDFKNILRVRKDICNIAILGDNGRYFINSTEDILNQDARLEEKKWYQNAQKAGEMTYISGSHVQNMVKGKYEWVVTMSWRLKNPKSGQVEGMLLLDLNYEVIRDLCESISLGERGYVYIVDVDGKIVYHPQQQLILSDVKRELLTEIAGQNTSVPHTDSKNEKIYTSFYSEKTGWTIVGAEYFMELVENEKILKRDYTIMAWMSIMLAVFLAIIVARRISRPIKQLQEAMNQVKQGHFEPVHIEVGMEDEIYQLQQNFNSMVCRIDELMQENIRKEEEKREIEMKALQAQINPHFLYNTLDSIIWMVEAEESERAIQMTSALARLFRQAIGKSDVFVTLREELEYTENYLIIQQMRYEDKLSYKMQVDDRILNYEILKLILQPLVENALYHGLKYKESMGMIQIIGYIFQEKLILKVEDNGIGMNSQTLENIFSKKSMEKKSPPGIPQCHAAGTRKKHSGIGMGNIKRRLKLYYGERCEFRVESEEGKGTTVTVAIPLERKDLEWMV